MQFQTYPPSRGEQMQTMLLYGQLAGGVQALPLAGMLAGQFDAASSGPPPPPDAPPSLDASIAPPPLPDVVEVPPAPDVDPDVVTPDPMTVDPVDPDVVSELVAPPLPPVDSLAPQSIVTQKTHSHAPARQRLVVLMVASREVSHSFSRLTSLQKCRVPRRAIERIVSGLDGRPSSLRRMLEDAGSEIEMSRPRHSNR
jgi:hypothetical protein